MDCGGLRPTDSNLVVAPSTADNYFSEQALRAGMSRGEGMVNQDPLRREVFQREYEKERIREEIIRDEIRRRELEAEVRREMAVEREMALRRGEGYSLLGASSAPSLWSDPRLGVGGMMDIPLGVGYGFPERLPLPIRAEPEPFERLPFQRIPAAAKISEAGNGQPKVIHLAKPITTASPVVAGTKRKITAIQDASESSKASLKKKPQEWNCSLCQVTTTSEDGLQSHFLGKKHRSKEALQKTNALKKKNNTCLKNDNKPEMQAVKKKQMTPDMKKRKFPFWCEDCQIGCHSECVMENHCKGRKHILRAGKQAGGSASSTTTTKKDNTPPETTTTENVIATSETTTKNDLTAPEMVEDNEDKDINNEEEGETKVKEVETEVKEEAAGGDQLAENQLP